MSRYPLRIVPSLLAVGVLTGVTIAVAGPAQAAPSTADTTFITSNEQTNLAEIAIGQLALSKAQSAQARDLASTTLADHQAAMGKLAAVASALGVTLPTTPNANQQQQAATLQATAPDAFDGAYAQIQVAGHEDSIAATNTELASGSDQSVVSYAQYYLPIAQKHLGMAQQLVAATGGSPGTVPAGTGGQAATTSTTTEAIEFGLISVGGLLAIGAGVGLFRRYRVNS